MDIPAFLDTFALSMGRSHRLSAQVLHEPSVGSAFESASTLQPLSLQPRDHFCNARQRLMTEGR